MHKDKSLRANKNLLQATRKLVDDLHQSLGRPWSFDEGPGVFSRYRTSEGKINFSKLIRNVSFAQRLYKMQDEITNTVIAIQILRDEVGVADESHDIKASTMKDVEFENLSIPTVRAVTCYFSALAYFFDFPSKDNFYNMEETVNFTYLRNPKLGSMIAGITQAEHFKLNLKVNDELEKGYFGLSKITFKGNSPFTIKAAGAPSHLELVEASEKVLLDLHRALSLLLEVIEAEYSDTLGYVSPDDLIVKSENENSAWLRSDGIEPDAPKLFKLFNLWSENGRPIETTTYRIKRNYLYKYSLDRQHRSGDKHTRSYKMGVDAPAEATSTVKKAQEGEHVWTHTLEFKRPIKREGYRRRRLEDACLILTFISGYAVYSENSAKLYSHKAKGLAKYMELEYGQGLAPTAKVLAAARKADADFYRLILSKYRQAIQPATIEGQIIRVWEILDVIADYYCVEDKKDLPSGYKDHSELTSKIKEALKEIEPKVGAPLTGDTGYTPVFVQKSIGQKVREMLQEFQIADILEVDYKDLKKRVSNTYGMRSKLTHSATSNGSKTSLNELVSAYFFVNELTFLLMTRVFNHPVDTETVNSLKRSLGGFVADADFYVKRHRMLKRKGKKIDEVFEILAGRKPWPKSKKEISL